MNFIKKIQGQPESVRKMILWSVVVILGLGLAIWWINNSYQKFKEFEKEKFMKDLPAFEKELFEIEIPKIEMPKIDK